MIFSCLNCLLSQKGLTIYVSSLSSLRQISKFWVTVILDWSLYRVIEQPQSTFVKDNVFGQFKICQQLQFAYHFIESSKQKLYFKIMWIAILWFYILDVIIYLFFIFFKLKYKWKKRKLWLFQMFEHRFYFKRVWGEITPAGWR